MKIYYSPYEVGFFTSEIEEVCKRSGTWPENLTEITAEQHAEYSGAPPAGKRLGTVDGAPGWVDCAPLSEEETTAINEMKRTDLRNAADAEIAWRQDAVDAGIATDEETIALAEWKKYRVLLMRVDTAKPVWPTPPVTG